MPVKSNYKNLTVRMDEDIKNQFDETLDYIGLNASVAVNMFARLVIREKGIPFAVTGKLNTKYPGTLISTEKEAKIAESVEAANKLFGFLSDNFDFDEMRMERLK